VRTQGRRVCARRRAERWARQRGRLEACHAGHHKAGRHARHHAAWRRLVEACADASPPRSGACFSCHCSAALRGHPLSHCVQDSSTVGTSLDNVVPDLTSSHAGEGAARGNGLQTGSAVLTSTCAPSSPSSCKQAHAASLSTMKRVALAGVPASARTFACSCINRSQACRVHSPVFVARAGALAVLVAVAPAIIATVVSVPHWCYRREPRSTPPACAHTRLA